MTTLFDAAPYTYKPATGTRYDIVFDDYNPDTMCDDRMLIWDAMIQCRNGLTDNDWNVSAGCDTRQGMVNIEVTDWEDRGDHIAAMAVVVHQSILAHAHLTDIRTATIYGHDCEGNAYVILVDAR